MNDRAIAPRYAKVMFDLDVPQGKLERRLADFDAVIKVLQDNPKLIKLFKTPHMSLEEKKKIIEDILDGNFDKSFLNFLYFLIKKGRQVSLQHISDAYRHMVNDHLGIWEANLITAVPMDSESEQKLKRKLEQQFHKKVRLNKRIDPSIVGGAILEMDNQMLDWSVTGRLRKLKDALLSKQV